MKEIGSKTKQKEPASSLASPKSMVKAPDTKENGTMTSRTEKEQRPGQMDPTTKATMSTGRSKEKASLPGRTARSLRVTSLRIKSTELGRISGQMARNIPGNGRTIRCLGRANSPGTIIGLTWEDLSMTSSMDRVRISTEMGRCTKEALKRA